MAAKLQLNEGIAVVTGAASGIGKETAYAFAEAGVQGVVFADINLSGAREAAVESKFLASHVKYRALPIKVDVSDDASVQTLFCTAAREFGRIDYVVHSAGIANISSAATADLDMAAFDKLHAINTRGTLLCIRAASHIMAAQKPRTHPGSGRHASRSLGRGSIVVLGSANSYVAVPGLMSYVASKHAVAGIVKNASLDNMKHHIRVNSVCPGWVDTPMMNGAFSRIEGMRALIEKTSPLRRIASTEEVADYVVFLCSPSATYINGTGLCVDAGVTLATRGSEG